MLPLEDFIRSYIFDVKGETIRAFFITVFSALVQAIYKQDLATVTDWTAWARGLALAAAIAAIAFVAGRVPPSKPIT